MGNTQVKSDITPEQYAEYMKLKQQAEYQKQLAISKENNYRQPIQFRPPVQPPNVSTPKLQANYQQPNIIPDTRPVSQYNENEKRSNIDINVRNSMNNMGINYRMVDSLKNPIGENTLVETASLLLELLLLLLLTVIPRVSSMFVERGLRVRRVEDLI